MRILLLSPGYDVAGQMAALRDALLAVHPDWTVDQMARLRKSYGYPQHRAWEMDLARKLWRQADVVHVTESLAPVEWFGERPNLIVHQHGTRYRENRTAVDAACAKVGAVQVATTLDLVGTAEWLPVVANLDALRRMRAEEYQPADLVRIAHSPTDPATKGTVRIEAAVQALHRRGVPVALDVITGVSWAECLRRKARADIFVDQLELGYGLSAVEAWAMGLPVVAGVADPALRERMLTTFGTLPFATGPLDATLERLILGSAERLGLGGRGAQHVERFHSQRAVVARLEDIYARHGLAVAA